MIFEVVVHGVFPRRAARVVIGIKVVWGINEKETLNWLLLCDVSSGERCLRKESSRYNGLQVLIAIGKI